MKNKTLFEGIKCLTRRYTVLALIMLGVLINVLFYIAEYILKQRGFDESIWYHQIVLLGVTTLVLVGVISVFLVNLDSIRDEMVSNLHKLISIIRNQTPNDFSKKIEIDAVSCDDEVYEIVSVLNSRSEQIEQYINHLKYVIGYIQHEFNTPLATLALSIERLQKNHSSINFSSLEEDVHTLSKIMNSLSYLSSRDRKNIVCTDLEVVSITTKVVDLLHQIYEDGTISYHGEESMKVFSNEIYLHIILKNIIENSLKYSLNKKNVEIHFNEEDSSIIIKDYGKGMSPEEMKKIGLPFWQGDSSRGKDNGFGLGLTLVYELADILGIEIDVSSQLDKGTAFTLKFNNNSHA